MLCLPRSRSSGPEHQPLLSRGAPGGRLPCPAQLTLHPKCEELLHGARRVLGHTHVAGNIGHLCRGNLWVQREGAWWLWFPFPGTTGRDPLTTPGTAGTRRNPTEGHLSTWSGV